jgi:hypothetical protein
MPDPIYEKLGHYVYALLDPRGDRPIPFYIGKGTGDRLLSHFSNGSQQTCARIDEIRKAGFEPGIAILAFSLNSEDESLLVERCSIDFATFLGLPLTNLVRGHGSCESGLSLLEHLRTRFATEFADFTEPGVIIKINQRFQEDMNEKELYDATRGYWAMSPLSRPRVPKYVYATAAGVIREVFEVQEWREPTPPIRDSDRDLTGRVEFVGHRAPDPIRGKYLGKLVLGKTGAANPIRYVG